ncbi:MAG: MarR family transcriptional regulator [Nocardia sp.]|nr:MarR family transcriptional regulator [Nocardia sp.]
MTELATRYTLAELRAIGDWIHRTTEILVANTRRISAPDFGSGA